MSSSIEPELDLLPAPVALSEVRACLGSVLKSVGFRRSARLARFLAFLVDHALLGNGTPLKEYVIGVEVFDRPAAYDPRLDPIVRVEARRLRTKLREYYKEEGANDPVYIQIPARGYVPAFRARPSALSSASAGTCATSAPISLAILPLVSLDSNARLRSFAEGLTDEIASLLSSLPGFQIVARTSAFHFRDRAADIRDIGAELDAEYVLEGSIRKERKRVRVLVQIASSNSGFRVWSGSYEQEVDSAFAAQAEIARRIIADLDLKIPGRMPLAADTRPIAARTMLALYQKGRRYLNSRTNDGIRRGIACFQEVIERDSTCALAYAGLADGYSLGARYDVFPPQESWRKARAAALDAVRIDYSLAEAHTALGFVELHYLRNTSAAEHEFCTAIQLNPRYAPARQWYAWCLIASGRAEMAIETIKAALDLDPFSPNARADLALALYFSRQFKESILECDRTLRSTPGFYRCHQLMGLDYLQTGDYAKAIEHFGFAIASSGRNSRMLVLLARAYAANGQLDEATRVASELTFPDNTSVPAMDFALLYSALGDFDRTFQYLERAFLEDEGELIWMPIDPIHDSLRGDPRFVPFLERIGTGLTGASLLLPATAQKQFLT